MFDVKRVAVYIILGKEQTKKQPTAKEHVEMFLKFNLRLFLS
jgi:HKD family nuclease